MTGCDVNHDDDSKVPRTQPPNDDAGNEMIS
jgi:hypothetical protein